MDHANYKKYIDAIAAIVSREFFRLLSKKILHVEVCLQVYPSVKVVAVVEPDSLANLVTNLSDPNCANAQSA